MAAMLNPQINDCPYNETQQFQVEDGTELLLTCCAKISVDNIEVHRTRSETSACETFSKVDP